MDDESERLSRNTLIAVWSFLSVFAIACVFFVVWYSNSSNHAKIAAANDRISEAVGTANEWIAVNSPLDGEAVEQRLVAALKNDDATERAVGEAALATVQQQREKFVEQAKAAAILKEAKTRLEENDVEKAIELLREYVADSHATQMTDAQRLLGEAETAVSDSHTLEALVAMTDEDFDRVIATGEIRDGKVTHPVLTAARSETIHRNLKQVTQRREEIRLAEEKRREQAAQRREEIMLAEEKRRESERLERKQAELLRTRTPDVRNVCWGDSRQTVKQVEKIPLKQDGDSLSGKVELNGREAILLYSFYDDKIVSVSYWIDLDEFGNPFELDVPLRSTLEDKYGEGKTETFGISIGAIDMSAASRETVWSLPRHTIKLDASSYRTSGRHLFLTYEAKTAEAKAYKEQQKRKAEESLRKGQEKLKKNL